MKVAILAGGLGTRLSEETQIGPRPKISKNLFPYQTVICSPLALEVLLDGVIKSGQKKATEIINIAPGK